jgi:hypothetical protein
MLRAVLLRSTMIGKYIPFPHRLPVIGVCSSHASRRSIMPHASLGAELLSIQLWIMVSGERQQRSVLTPPV